jgi:hypothetical protein
MGIRESMNRKPGLMLGAAIVLCVLGGFFVFRQWKSGNQDSFSVREWYTTDDGQTWFADEMGKFVPFQHEGKPAYRCHVWTCDGGKTKFVSHLERIPPDIKKQLDGMDPKRALVMFDPSSMEVKPPLTGDQGWVNMRAPHAEAIITPKCPGGTGTPTMVSP